MRTSKNPCLKEAKAKTCLGRTRGESGGQTRRAEPNALSFPWAAAYSPYREKYRSLKKSLFDLRTVHIVMVVLGDVALDVRRRAADAHVRDMEAYLLAAMRSHPQGLPRDPWSPRRKLKAPTVLASPRGSTAHALRQAPSTGPTSNPLTLHHMPLRGQEEEHWEAGADIDGRRAWTADGGVYVNTIDRTITPRQALPRLPRPAPEPGWCHIVEGVEKPTISRNVRAMASDTGANGAPSLTVRVPSPPYRPSSGRRLDPSRVVPLISPPTSRVAPSTAQPRLDHAEVHDHAPWSYLAGHGLGHGLSDGLGHGEDLSPTKRASPPRARPHTPIRGVVNLLSQNSRGLAEPSPPSSPRATNHHSTIRTHPHLPNAGPIAGPTNGPEQLRAAWLPMGQRARAGRGRTVLVEPGAEGGMHVMSERGRETRVLDDGPPPPIASRGRPAQGVPVARVMF